MKPNHKRKWLDRETKAVFKRNIVLLFCLALLLAPFNTMTANAYAENNNNNAEQTNENSGALNSEAAENNSKAEKPVGEEKSEPEPDNSGNHEEDSQTDETPSPEPKNKGGDESGNDDQAPKEEVTNEDEAQADNVGPPEILAQEAQEDPSALIDIPVKKEWIGAPTPSLLIMLYKNDQIESHLLLKPENNWEGVFSDLPKYERVNDESDFPPLFKEIDYRVEEIAPSYYSQEKTGSINEGFVFTNTNNTTIDIDVTKEWIGPEWSYADFKLLADGEETTGFLRLTDNNNWEGTFEDLPKYDAETGEEIQYEVVEEELDWYTQHVSGSASEGFTFTNVAHSTESVLVEKLWNGEAQPVTFKLFANGEDTGQEMTLDGTESWGWSDRFEDLREYDDDGEKIIYDVEEVELDGYTTYKSVNRNGAEDRFSFTNMENIEIEVTKEWVGEPYNFAKFYLKDKNDQILQNLTLNGINDSWHGAFDPVQKYDYDTGELIEYYVEEVPFYDYTTEVEGSNEEGYIFTNIHKDIVIDVEKKWVGQEEDSATFTLYNEDGKEIDVLELDEDDGWKGSFVSVPRHDASGEPIEYTVEEEEIPGYTTTVTGSNEEGYTFTNISEETAKLIVEKYWFGDVLDSATFTLYADGVNTGKTMTLTEDDAVNLGYWEDAFTVPKYNLETGEEIDYTVEETPVEGYKTNKFIDDYSDSDNVINFFFDNIQLIDIPVKKEWIGAAGDAAIFHLVVNGEETEQTLELTADDNWEGTFKDLPLFETDIGLIDVIKYEYDVVEADNEGYQMTDKSGSVEEGFTFTNTNNELIEIDVEKIWKGKEGDSATFILNNADGKELQTLTVDASTDWKGTFEGQRKYDSETGELIEYTVEEEAIPGYTTEVEGSNEDGYIFTNTKMDDPQAEVGYVTIEYRDMDGNHLTQSITLSGAFGDSYTSEEKEFDGYELNRIEGDVSGVFTETPERVIYVYKPIEDKDGTAVDQDKDKDGTVVTMIGDDDTDKGIGSMLPKTATPYYTVGLIGLLLLAAGGIIMFVRRKKSA